MKFSQHQLMPPMSQALFACTIVALVFSGIPIANNQLHAQAGAEGLVIPLTASNNHGNSTSLRIGIHSMATKGLDEALGERELPPAPPGGIYDVRMIGPDPSVILGEGSLIDVRPWRSGTAIFSENYRILYQAGGARPSVTVRLPASLPHEIKQLRIDGKTLRAGDSAVSLLPSATMNIIVDFDLAPPSVNVSPSSLVFTVSESDTATPPARTVRITPSVDGGDWSASARESWISLDRTMGAGESDLHVGISRITFAEGRSSGVVEIRTVGNDQPTILTVHVDMTTPLFPIHAPATCAIRSVSPHPVGTGRMALVAYETGIPALVTLTVTDMLGRLCATLLRSAMQEPGVHTVRFSTAESGLHPGVYYLRLVAGRSMRIYPLIIN